MPNGQSACVALKVQTKTRGKTLETGWIGWAQKKAGNWGAPLTNTDYILMATPYQGGLGVWMFPTAEVRDRLELLQQRHARLHRAPSGSLWLNLFDVVKKPAELKNFARGRPPMWVLAFEVSEESENGGLQVFEDKQAEPTQPPSGLTAFSNGQLIDELMRRGLRSFSFG